MLALTALCCCSGDRCSVQPCSGWLRGSVPMLCAQSSSLLEPVCETSKTENVAANASKTKGQNLPGGRALCVFAKLPEHVLSAVRLSGADVHSVMNRGGFSLLASGELTVLWCLLLGSGNALVSEFLLETCWLPKQDRYILLYSWK